MLLSYLMTAVTMAAGFAIIPNIPSYLLGNLGFPQRWYGLLYAAGGAVSFLTLRVAGRLVDRLGSFRVVLVGSIALGVVLWVGFVRYVPGLPVVALFMAFMLAMAFRNVGYNTLTSKVPNPDERARFMSIQSAVQHFASAAGAFVSARLLWELPGGGLGGMPRVALVSIGLTGLLPFLVAAVERRVRARAIARPPAVDPQTGLSASRPGLVGTADPR